MAEKVVLDLVANIDPIKEALSKLPPEMRKNAAGAVRELEKSLKRAERAAGKSAKKSAGSWRKTGEAAEGVKRIFDAAGGSAAGYAGTIEHLTRSALNLGSALGPVGIAAGAAAAAIGAVATAAITAALNTSDLVKELEAAGEASPISESQARDVRQMDQAIEALKDEFKVLAVIVGAQAAPAIRDFVTLAAKGVKVVGDFAENAQAMARMGATIGTLGGLQLGESIAAWIQGKGKPPAKTIHETVDATKAYLAELDDLIVTIDDVEQAEDKKTVTISRGSDAAREAARAAREAAQAAKDAAREKARLEAEEAARKQAAIEAIERMRQAEAQRRAEEAAAAQAAIELAKREAREKQDLAFATAASISGSLSDLAAQEAQRLSQGTERQRRAAKTAFKISQALAVAQTIINTSAGITRAFQDVPYPFSIAAAASVAATGAVQTAAVLSQRPNFATGGVMDADHRPAMLQPGEGVLTRAGVENAGGAEGIAALNQGRQGGGPVQAYVVFDHRWYDRGARQNIQRGGAIGQAISRRTRPIGHKEYSR